MLTNIETYNGFCSNVYVSRETFEKLCIFNNTLIKWQSSINLIGKNSKTNIWERHFLDSAQLYKYVEHIEGNIIDFGSGAGFLNQIPVSNTDTKIFADVCGYAWRFLPIVSLISMPSLGF